MLVIANVQRRIRQQHTVLPHDSLTSSVSFRFGKHMYLLDARNNVLLTSLGSYHFDVKRQKDAGLILLLDVDLTSTPHLSCVTASPS
jgi:hypothetical protein